jgi:hypothetical protein
MHPATGVSPHGGPQQQQPGGTLGGGAPGDPQIMALLLQEAQAQIGKLRAELYGVGRAAEERRWDLKGAAGRACSAMRAP